ncbi:T9SS type A sorting domain-containing protein [Falsiporphyromonas endometrii]|uniref:T9SS type A sorting domain-containing protein n=1 Tax=Falsiporphyromonas endometrii TaxID=1387297 RepID=A0ABV9K7A9_9PORP
MKQLLLCLCASAYILSASAQSNPVQIIGGPELIPAIKSNQVQTLGVSSDGHYLWGQTISKSTGFYYDLVEKKAYDIEAGDEVVVYSVFPNGDIVYNSDRKAYYRKAGSSSSIEIKSPISDYPYFDIWSTTHDGKIIVGNLSDDGYSQVPAYAELGEDGLYSIHTLDFESKDIMGANAQYSQTRTVTQDGKYIVGQQVNDMGNNYRILVWSRQQDGTYKYSTPFDHIEYDLSKPKPGVMPDYGEYVTATDENSQEYKDQLTKYNAAMDEWERKFSEFTKHGSTFGGYSIHRATLGHAICTYFVDGLKDPKVMNPALLDVENNTNTVLNLDGGTGFDLLPGGGIIALVGNAYEGFDTYAVSSKDNTSVPLDKWLKDKTGVDIAKSLSESEVTKMGLPYFSMDGKTLALSTYDNEGFVCAVINFDKNIFAALTSVDTPIRASLYFFDGKMLHLQGDKPAEITIYDMNGRLCLSMQVDAESKVDLASRLRSGQYIVSVKDNDKKESSMKIIMK